MKEFILVIKGPHARGEDALGDYRSFVDRLRSQNRFMGGSALGSGGVEIRGAGEATIVDGPFPQSREAFNGYFVFKAENLDEAVSIAKGCPALSRGESIELFEQTSH